MARSSIVQPEYPDQQQQDTENARAIAGLAELIENAITVAENYLAYTDGRLPPLGAKGKTLKEAQAEFQKRYRHEQPCGWNEDKVMERCEQKVSKEQIAEVTNRPVLDVGSVTASLHQLDTTEKLPKGRYLVLKDNLAQLRRHQGPDAVVSLPDSLTALYDIQHVDATATIREELAEMEPAKQKFLAQVSEAQAVYDTAVSRGDVVEVERAHRHLIAARYEHIVFCAKRLLHLNSSENDEDVNSFAEELQRMQAEAEDAIQQFKEEKERMTAALKEDIGGCDKALEEERQKHEEAVAAYTAKEAQVNDRLAEVVDRKTSLIEELRQKALELRSLMEEQKTLVQDGIDAKREEEARATAFNEFANIEEQHRQRLERCLAYYEGCAPVTQEVEKYVADMVKNLPEDDVKAALQKISDEEAGVFMEAYKKFVFACGELTVKKTHRLDTLERQARLTKHNRDTAMESLDPNMENYRIELEDLVAQMKAVEGVINALNATQDAGEQVYESVEDPVRNMYERSGATFVHPLQEFGYESVEQRNRFVDRSMKYVEGEEHAVSHKRSQLTEMKAIVDQENYALERAIAAADQTSPTPAAAIEM